MSAASNTVEPMEWDQPSTSHDSMSAQESEEAPVSLFVRWSDSVGPRKPKFELQKALQTWANNYNKESGMNLVCNVQSVSEDGRAEVMITPAPAVSKLQELRQQTLPMKDGTTVTITSVSLTPADTQTPAASPTIVPPMFVSVPQHDKVELEKQSVPSDSAAVPTAAEEACLVPVSHFWYLSHIYREEIKRIEKKNGVCLNTEVSVVFTGQKDGNPQKARSEFINLVQKCLGESHGFEFPLKNVDSEDLRDTLNIINKPDNKLLLALTSEKITVYGPSRSQEAIKRTLKATEKTLTSNHSSAAASSGSSPYIGLNIKDPFASDGVTLDGSCWKQVTTSFRECIDKIEDKFGVRFKESGNNQGKVVVKATHKSSGGNMAMENHAVRALFRLYQKIITSPMNFTQTLGAVGFSGLPENLLNSLSAHSKLKTEAGPEEGAAAGDSDKDETCSICLERVTKKKQLPCGHEFCEKCLTKLVETTKPICPVCRDVFGIVNGNQPNGRMSSHMTHSSLPGFPDCNTIVIKYDIPSGKQTEKHPNPGRPYPSTERTAYLPNNREGQEVLSLLKKAFDQRLIFTVGVSRTSGKNDQVTWNDIHHKTSITGGPTNFGYPDPHYLSRVKEELKAKGIK